MLSVKKLASQGGDGSCLLPNVFYVVMGAKFEANFQPPPLHRKRGRDPEIHALLEIRQLHFLSTNLGSCPVCRMIAWLAQNGACGGVDRADTADRDAYVLHDQEVVQCNGAFHFHCTNVFPPSHVTQSQKPGLFIAILGQNSILDRRLAGWGL